MRHSVALAGLDSFVFSKEEEEALLRDFRLVVSDYKLENRSSVAALSSHTEPGLYFWVLGVGANRYKVYVGKTRSLFRRVQDYTNGFQPHSPNDFKLQVLQSFVK